MVLSKTFFKLYMWSIPALLLFTMIIMYNIATTHAAMLERLIIVEQRVGMKGELLLATQELEGILEYLTFVHEDCNENTRLALDLIVEQQEDIMPWLIGKKIEDNFHGHR